LEQINSIMTNVSEYSVSGPTMRDVLSKDGAWRPAGTRSCLEGEGSDNKVLEPTLCDDRPSKDDRMLQIGRYFINTVLQGPIPEPGNTRQVRLASMVSGTDKEITIHPFWILPYVRSTASSTSSSAHSII